MGYEDVCGDCKGKIGFFENRIVYDLKECKDGKNRKFSREAKVGRCGCSEWEDDGTDWVFVCSLEMKFH